MKARAIAAVLVLAACCGYAPAQVATAAPANGDLYTAHMEAGVIALRAQRYADAADDFKLALARRSDSSQAALLAGEALVYGRMPDRAIPLLERSNTLDPDSVHLHELLASAYAGAGHGQERDAELDLLRKWHDDGQHPSLAAPGFILETIYSGPFHVNVQDYFHPTPEHPTMAKFTVRDRAEIIENVYCLTSWPLNPDGSAAGTRYALTACQNSEPHPVHFYDQQPNYTEVRADLVQVLHHSHARVN